MLTCKEASHLISEKHDRHLGIAERIVLRLHVFFCDNCQRFERQMALLHDALKTLRNEAMSSDQAELNQQAKERIREGLRKNGVGKDG